MVSSDDSAVPLLRLMSVASRWLANELNDKLAEAGFGDQRMAHHSVFAHLPASGRRLTDLADAAGISKQAMYELVVDLERLGYVQRSPDPNDGRARTIAYTDRGRRCAAAAFTAFREIEADLEDRLGHRRVSSLRALLREIPVD